MRLNHVSLESPGQEDSKKVSHVSVGGLRPSQLASKMQNKLQVNNSSPPRQLPTVIVAASEVVQGWVAAHLKAMVFSFPVVYGMFR